VFEAAVAGGAVGVEDGADFALGAEEGGREESKEAEEEGPHGWHAECGVRSYWE
jgi:hypothetical protein